MTETSNEDNLFHIHAICERLPFTRPNPIDDGKFADHCTGNWKDVPAWAIRRMNFYIERKRFSDESRCPLMWKNCPRTEDTDEPLSCYTVKHCYPYVCDGRCGHNEMWVSDDEKKILEEYRKKKYG